MTSRQRALGSIDRDLMMARRLLDGVAAKIRRAKFAPKRNLSRVGHALVNIFDVQEEIHLERPDLIPAYLRGTDYERRALSNKRLERSAGKARKVGSTRRGGGRSTPSR